MRYFGKGLSAAHSAGQDEHVKGVLRIIVRGRVVSVRTHPANVAEIGVGDKANAAAALDHFGSKHARENDVDLGTN